VHSIKARDYLADDFDMQAEDSPNEVARGYRAVADYLRALTADDVQVIELSTFLHPFLTDDPRLGGTLYPDGDAIRFMDSFVPDADPEICEEYLASFLRHLRRDHRRWSAHVAARGADAAWTLARDRPASGGHLPDAPRGDTDHGATTVRGLGELSGEHDTGRASGDVRNPHQEGQRAALDVRSTAPCSYRRRRVAHRRGSYSPRARSLRNRLTDRLVDPVEVASDVGTESATTAEGIVTRSPSAFFERCAMTGDHGCELRGCVW
jgi:hypothetical protein